MLESSIGIYHRVGQEVSGGGDAKQFSPCRVEGERKVHYINKEHLTLSGLMEALPPINRSSWV